MLAFAGQAGEVGQPVDRQVDLARRAAELEAADVFLEFGVERPGLHEAEERPAGVHRREDVAGLDLLAVLEGHAGRPAVLDDDPRDRGLGPDLGTERPRGGGDRVRHAARPALRDAPGAERAVDLAHVVVEQDVGRARRSDALVCPDDPATPPSSP